MSFSVKSHLPLISTRIEFQINQLPPPPAITLHKDLGMQIKHQIRRKKTPYNRKIREESISSPIRIDEAESESSLSPLSEDESSEEESSTVGPNGKVPKPPREAGRRNSGGFNLEKALGWETNHYNAMIMSFTFRSNRG